MSNEVRGGGGGNEGGWPQYGGSRGGGAGGAGGEGGRAGGQKAVKEVDGDVTEAMTTLATWKAEGVARTDATGLMSEG